MMTGRGLSDLRSVLPSAARKLKASLSDLIKKGACLRALHLALQASYNSLLPACLSWVDGPIEPDVDVAA